MWCPNCGATPLPADAGQCPICDVALPAAPSPQQDAAAVERASEQRSRLTFRFDSLMMLGAHFEAREVAREAATRTKDPAERATWAERVASLTERIRHELRIRVVECEGAAAPMPDLLAADHHPEDAPCWLTPSGRWLYLATTHGRWVFIRGYDMVERRVRTLVSLRAPEELERPHVVVEENTLWLVDDRGRLLELSSSTWNVSTWRGESSLCKPGERLNAVTLTPSTRTLWISATEDDLYGRTRRLHLDRKGTLPEDLGEESEGIGLLPGEEGLRVMALDRADFHVFSAAGKPLGRLGADEAVGHAAVSPGGDGFLLLADSRGGMHAPLAFVRATLDGEYGPPVPLEGSSGLRPASLATSREARLAFVHFLGRVRDSWLAAFAATHGGLQQVFRIPVEEEVLLAQDAFARKVVLLTPTDEDTSVVTLGSEAPRVSSAQSEESRLPVVAGYIMCWCGVPPPSERTERMAEHISHRPDAMRALTVQETLRREQADPDPLLALCTALEQRFQADSGDTIARFAWERHAGHPSVELHRASRELGAGQWSAALARLDGIDASALDRRQTCHLHHLRGLAHYHLGRPREALAELRRGEPLEEDGACRLKHWITLVSGVIEPSPLPEVDPGQPYLQQLIRAIRVADDLLLRGDAVGAAKVLDRWAVWRCDDLQGLARLAQAWLLREPPAEADRFRKALVLAAFVRRQAARSRGLQLDIPLEMAWSEERFARLAGQARDWLDRAG